MKIFFQHIPKTAGSSLVAHATAHFGDAVCRARYDYQITDAMLRDESLTFFQGHFSLAVVKRFKALNPDGFVFTLVRHPFARTLSQVFNWTDRARVSRELYLSGPPANAHAARLRRKFETRICDLSLDTFLKSRDPDIRQVIGNLQAQYLTDVEFPVHLRLSKAAVNAAVHYDFIGLQELYGPCLRIVETKCGLPAGVLGGTQRANTNDNARTDGCYRVTPHQLSLIERCNTYDTAVFHVCHALLLGRYGEHLPESALDIGKLIDWPELASNAVPRLAPATA